MTDHDFNDYLLRLDKSLGDDVVHYVEEENPPEDGVFEIALVMAGAISAGCYSAGVLDYLIEALDAWEDEKCKPGNHAPQHKVQIRVFAGASAGSMTAAIAAAALRYDFQHITSSTVISPGVYTNPFYESWVRRIRADDLLGNNDLKTSPDELHSLLDGSSLTTICNDALDCGKVLAIKQRPYLETRVRFIFTQCGLAGTPYYLAINGPANSGMAMRMHKTYRSFSVHYGQLPARRRPDDRPLDAGVADKSHNADWASLGRAALGSGAFPVALPACADSRPATDIFYRYVTVPGNASDRVQVRRICPAWFALENDQLPTRLATVNEQIVDGGVMDNEPFDLARNELAGLIGFNERSGAKARRAVILIDPFPDMPDAVQNGAAASAAGIFSVAGGLIGAWKNQSRFNPVDLALATDNSVYSRYLIAPVRVADGQAKPAGKMTIASGCLKGFGGFLSEEFRHHDYLLGRRNCQQFLRKYFSLPDSNPLFSHNGQFDGNNARSAENNEVPLIPLVGALTLTEPLPAMPTTPVDVEALVDKGFTRLGNASAAAIRKSNMSGLEQLGTKIGVFLIRNAVKKKVQMYIEGGLREYGLKYKV